MLIVYREVWEITLELKRTNCLSIPRFYFVLIAQGAADKETAAGSKWQQEPKASRRKWLSPTPI
jgi:hypothetical protein